MLKKRKIRRKNITSNTWVCCHQRVPSKPAAYDRFLVYYSDFKTKG